MTESTWQTRLSDDELQKRAMRFNSEQHQRASETALESAAMHYRIHPRAKYKVPENWLDIEYAVQEAGRLNTIGEASAYLKGIRDASAKAGKPSKKTDMAALLDAVSPESTVMYSAFRQYLENLSKEIGIPPLQEEPERQFFSR